VGHDNTVKTGVLTSSLYERFVGLTVILILNDYRLATPSAIVLTVTDCMHLTSLAVNRLFDSPDMKYRGRRGLKLRRLGSTGNHE
jgi:hypothetical protein